MVKCKIFKTLLHTQIVKCLICHCDPSACAKCKNCRNNSGYLKFIFFVLLNKLVYMWPICSKWVACRLHTSWENGQYVWYGLIIHVGSFVFCWIFKLQSQGQKWVLRFNISQKWHDCDYQISYLFVFKMAADGHLGFYPFKKNARSSTPFCIFPT